MGDGHDFVIGGPPKALPEGTSGDTQSVKAQGGVTDATVKQSPARVHPPAAAPLPPQESRAPPFPSPARPYSITDQRQQLAAPGSPLVTDKPQVTDSHCRLLAATSGTRQPSSQ